MADPASSGRVHTSCLHTFFAVDVAVAGQVAFGAVVAVADNYCVVAGGHCSVGCHRFAGYYKARVFAG